MFARVGPDANAARAPDNRGLFVQNDHCRYTRIAFARDHVSEAICCGRQDCCCPDPELKPMGGNPGRAKRRYEPDCRDGTGRRLGLIARWDHEDVDRELPRSTVGAGRRSIVGGDHPVELEQLEPCGLRRGVLLKHKRFLNHTRAVSAAVELRGLRVSDRDGGLAVCSVTLRVDGLVTDQVCPDRKRDRPVSAGVLADELN